MSNTSETIYKISRKNAGLTQEEAAELLFTSPRNLYQYESGCTPPSDDMVLRMMDVYQDPPLAWRHLSENTVLGSLILPKVEIDHLASSYLKFVYENEDIDRDVIGKIAINGVVDAEEINVFQDVEKELWELISAAISLIYTGDVAKEKTPVCAGA